MTTGRSRHRRQALRWRPGTSVRLMSRRAGPDLLVVSAGRAGGDSRVVYDMSISPGGRNPLSTSSSHSYPSDSSGQGTRSGPTAARRRSYRARNGASEYVDGT